jgi:LmbE family N-acetylglucosaminyl deacetylase
MDDTTAPLAYFGRKAWKSMLRAMAHAARSPKLKLLFAVSSVLVLLATTVYWAILGAHLQQQNADQLSDPYMFESGQTFKGAAFPGAHTFLLKWPIFWLLGHFGVTPTSLMIATMAVVLVPIIVLICVLYKLDKRPLVFGTVCLALSLILLLVPAQAYPGGLLPVNMAMLTTRNLEYAVYLLVLVLFAKAHKVRRISFILGVLLLAVLIASDKLFLSLSAGGALLAIVVYALRSNWQLTAFASRWLFGTVVAAIGASALLYAITATDITHLVNGNSANPYGITIATKNLVLGSAYALLGLFTNLGANPVYDNRILSQLPSELAARLWSPTTFAYMVTLCILMYALYKTSRFVWPAIRSGKGDRLPPRNLFALSLVWSTVAAFGVFLVTDHYYAVDARYLTISLFTLAVVVVLELRKQEWRWPEDLLLISGAILVAIAVAVPATMHVHRQQTQALSTAVQRNKHIAEALKQHKVDVLVGDYWRVLPIKSESGNELNATPLSSCTQLSGTMTSKSWQPDLKKHSFAYLLTLDASLTNFPTCKLSDITAAYGRPNAVQIIAGTPTKPKEALLFYDQGSHPLPRHLQALRPSLLPVRLENLSNTKCEQPTTMNIVAHEDDDLLFLSPDLLHDIQSGRCVRSVFLTAGDAGASKFYWINRQLGSEIAYNQMLGTDAIWDHQTVEISQGQYVTVANPHGNSKVSLIFFNLPDGNTQGQGFAASGHQSLAKLQDSSLSYLRTVDGQSSYNSQQLIHALEQLMTAYHPADIHTQADVASSQYPDHSDHMAAGRFAVAATEQYGQQQFDRPMAIPTTRYIGYPIHGYAENVEGNDLDQKRAAFLAYGQYDGGVCHTLASCSETSVYGTYLKRQYTEEAAL